MTQEARAAQSPLPPPDPWLASLGPALATAFPGPVLDLACGAGQNILWLAGSWRAARELVGVDSSPVAVSKARHAARTAGLEARFEVWDVSAQGVPSGGWRVILVFHFLDRALFPALESALAPGGLLAYKTHLCHRLRGVQARPHRRELLLEPGELLGGFPGLTTVQYREWATPGASFAALLARRPAERALGRDSCSCRGQLSPRPPREPPRAPRP